MQHLLHALDRPTGMSHQCSQQKPTDAMPALVDVCLLWDIDRAEHTCLSCTRCQTEATTDTFTLTSHCSALSCRACCKKARCARKQQDIGKIEGSKGSPMQMKLSTGNSRGLMCMCGSRLPSVSSCDKHVSISHVPDIQFGVMSICHCLDDDA